MTGPSTIPLVPAFAGTATHVGTWPVGSDEWHAARSLKLGGSEIAAVLGLSPWDSRFSLWHRKRGTIGLSEVSPEMEWGTRLEPVVIAKFADQRGINVVHPAPHMPAESIELATTTSTPCVMRNVGSWTSDAYPIAVANPDALWWTGERWEVVETKFSVMGDGFGEQGTDEVPIHHRQQCQWYMGTFGIGWATVAVLVGGCDYREYRIEFDAAEFRQLIDAGADFLDDVLEDREPDIDSHSATYDAIKELHPDIWPEDVELSDTTAHAFILAQHALKQCKADERFARSLVADEMGNARRARWNGMSIATRQARNDGTPYVVAGRNLPTAADVAASMGASDEFGVTGEAADKPDPFDYPDDDVVRRVDFTNRKDTDT